MVIIHSFLYYRDALHQVQGDGVDATIMKHCHVMLHLLRRKGVPLSVKLVHYAAAHQEINFFKQRHIAQRASVQCNDIRVTPGQDCDDGAFRFVRIVHRC